MVVPLQYRVGEITNLLVISTKTVKRILARYEENGTLDPTEQRHGPECTSFCRDGSGAVYDE